MSAGGREAAAVAGRGREAAGGQGSWGRGGAGLARPLPSRSGGVLPLCPPAPLSSRLPRGSVLPSPEGGEQPSGPVRLVSWGFLSGSRVSFLSAGLSGARGGESGIKGVR